MDALVVDGRSSGSTSRTADRRRTYPPEPRLDRPTGLESRTSPLALREPPSTAFARRVFGFDHLIEVYKPAPQRRYGYYVLRFSGATGSSAVPT